MRPANFPKGSPGRGHTVVESNGLRLGVINLSGQVFLDAVRSPFAEADALLSELRGQPTPCSSTCTPRSRARRSRSAGTSTGGCRLRRDPHPRPDRRRARAARRDRLHHATSGMTGPRGGVIGVKKEQAIERFLTLTQVRFETATEDPWLNAVLVEADSDGRATSIRQLLVPADA